MNKHDLEKSFVHTNPEPTTDPPLFPAMKKDKDIATIVKNAKAEERERCARVCDELSSDEGMIAIDALKAGDQDGYLAHWNRADALAEIAAKIRGEE